MGIRVTSHSGEYVLDAKDIKEDQLGPHQGDIRAVTRAYVDVRVRIKHCAK